MVTKTENVYRLTPLFPGKDKEPTGGIADSYMIGEHGKAIFVAVPETTSYASVADLRKILLKKFDDREIIILSNNVEFLQLTKLAENDAKKIITMHRGESADE